MKPFKPTGREFTDLPSGIIPIDATKTTVKFNLSHRTFRHSINQIPIAPPFSITTDKSQGLTFKKTIIDCQKTELRSRPPTQILYVALSRVTDPNMMRFIENISLEYLNQFTPSKVLLEVDKILTERSKA